MRNLSLLSFAFSTCALALSSTVALSADMTDETYSSTKSTSVWIGGEAGEFGHVGYAGFVSAVNGDINANDILLRVSGAFGKFEYDAAGTNIEVDQLTGDIMLGYQAVTNEYIASIYAGLDFQDNDLSIADPNNSTAGSKTGFKVQGEYRTRGNENGFISLLGNYSTANKTYFTRARLGVNVGNGIHIGPEVALLGNDEFDGRKIGGFIGGIQLGELNLTVNAGHSSASEENSKEGFYGGATVSFQF